MLTEYEKNRRTAEKLRLIDDDFLRLYFNDNPEGVEFILRIILEPVFIGKMYGFSRIILTNTRKKFAGILTYCKDF